VIYPARFDRRAWLEVPFGWMLADTLDGPHLVYEFHPFQALEDQAIARSRYFELRRRRDKDRAAQFRTAVAQVRRAHRVLVSLAVGYTFFDQWDVATFGRPVRVLWRFQ